jgi:hypothetical protein
MSLPFEQSAQPAAEYDQKINAAPPLVKELSARNLEKFRVRYASYVAEHATFRAGVAVVLGGSTALLRYKDPFGPGTFEYKKLPHGFELRSKLMVEGEQFWVIYGPDPHGK